MAPAGRGEVSVLNVAFVLEQALGHVTHSLNLKASIGEAPAIRPHWAPVPFAPQGGLGRMPVVRSNWTVRAGLTARRLLSDIEKTTRLDALFIHTQVPAVLCRDWLSRLPTVVSLDATPVQYDALGKHYQHEVGHPWLEAAKTWANRACFERAAHLVTWSRWASDSLVDEYGIPRDKITVIPPGVRIADWAVPEEAARARPDAPRILFVGGDFARKGGDLLLRAFRRIRDTGAHLHAVTREAGQDEPGLHWHVGLTPNSPALQDLYRTCNIFALPTSADCLPMALQEAAAAGLATVSTRVAGIPEIVLDGSTGFLVADGDEEALADRLRILATQTDLRRTFGAQAALHAARHFDAGANCAKLFSIIESEARTLAKENRRR